MARQYIILSLLLLFATLLYAQDQCLSNHKTIIHTDIEESILTRDNQVLTVVFHVIWNDEAENISDERIKSQLEVLNQDFNKKNNRLDQVPDVFKAFIADVGIEFCLANKDPEGNPTTGITRRKTQVHNIGLTDNYYQFSKGGQDNWDPEKYINIWVVSFGNSEIQGYASFPGQDPKAKDGIVMNYKYFGNKMGAIEPHHLGSSLTHEMGHYFGLQHPWGAKINDDCAEDDAIDDTPLQNGPTEGCPAFPKLDDCTQGSGIMFMNFMDYSDDNCLSMFTKGQKSFMLSNLMNFRSKLLDNQQCLSSSSLPAWNSNKVFPNPTSGSITLDFPSKDIQLINTQGQILNEWTKETSKIDLSSYTSGIYFLRIDHHIHKIIVLE